MELDIKSHKGRLIEVEFRTFIENNPFLTPEEFENGLQESLNLNLNFVCTVSGVRIYGDKYTGNILYNDDGKHKVLSFEIINNPIILMDETENLD